MAIEISKPDKPLFADAGITKAALADYFERIAPTLLPHVKDRPLTLRRFPDGINAQGFFQKDLPEHFPQWFERCSVKRKQGGSITHALASDADSLRYLADQATLELHAWTARRDKPMRPDRLVLDLDPAGKDIQPVIDAAREVRAILQEHDLTSFVMTTGSSGLHVVAPLDRGAKFEAVRGFAQQIARALAERHPKAFTIEHRKDKRRGRLYLDTRRNAYAQTAIAPYSTRALPEAPIATPLEWDEVNARLDPRRFDIGNIFRRLAQRACPWRHIDQCKQALP